MREWRTVVLVSQLTMALTGQKLALAWDTVGSFPLRRVAQIFLQEHTATALLSQLTTVLVVGLPFLGRGGLPTHQEAAVEPQVQVLIGSLLRGHRRALGA